MKTFNELVQERLNSNGIPANTANGNEMSSQIAKWRDLYNGYMFGIDTTDREKLFFEQSSVMYNHQSSNFKGHISKLPLAYAVADSVALDFYNKPVGSNGATYNKDVPNANAESAASIIARMNEIVANSCLVFDSISNIINSQLIKIYGSFTSVADVITFDQSQLLEVGGTLTIDSTEYSVLSENETGLI